MSTLSNATFAAEASAIAGEASKIAADLMGAIEISAIPVNGSVKSSMLEKYINPIEARLAKLRRLATSDR